jgi:hypothetical protein
MPVNSYPYESRVLEGIWAAGTSPDLRDDSGNSRCGHDFGTDLTPTQKKALIEYLKTL